jgi:hypothetical protein
MKFFVGLLVSLFAVSAFAQDFREVALPSGGYVTIGQAVPKVLEMQKRAHAAATPMQPRPDVVLIDFPNNAFLIPISGNTAGSFGTYFKSDVTIANLKNAQQYVSAGYFQQGLDNTNANVKVRLFGPGEITTFRDFVGSSLGKSGIGSLFIYASDSVGNPDGNGEIDGYSRIWTPQPGSTGEVSQNFDAVDTNDLIGDGVTYILGLRQDTRFRSNVGIVNFSSTQHTWTVTSLSSGATSSITVLPYSVVQTGIAAGSANSSGDVQLGISTTSGDSWSAYGTTNDNTTGDGWVSRAKRFIP